MACFHASTNDANQASYRSYAGKMSFIGMVLQLIGGSTTLRENSIGARHAPPAGKIPFLVLTSALAVPPM
jgi:hypothetical protein